MLSQNHLKILSVLSLALLTSASLLLPSRALAQIIPDKTTGTQVIPNLAIQGISSELITAGTVKGSNLFHSFQELNIASDRGLYFSNPANITNIFTRVTGSNPSNILGRLGVLGTANLFLLNPNGLLFGENSSLALSGSLYATTSDRLRFADNSTFSTINPESGAVLSSSIPIGLGFSSSSSNGIITVRSQAEPLSPLPLPPAVLRLIKRPLGLITLPDTAIALVGNEVNIENNGSIWVLGGNIEIGGVRNGEVALIPNGNKFALAYPNMNEFGDVKLSGNANITNIGNTGGNVQIIGNNVRILDMGLVLNASLGQNFNGQISVKANHLIEVAGSNNYQQLVLKLTSPRFDFKDINGFVSFGAGNSNGSDISLTAPQLILREAGVIISTILGQGKAGDITINAPESVILDASAISGGTSPVSTGTPGNVVVNTGTMILRNNAGINTSSFSSGTATSDIKINATRSLEIFGALPLFTSIDERPFSSGFGTIGFNKAASGNIFITTPYLNMQNGAILSTSTQGRGAGGLISIVTDRLDLSGRTPDNSLNSAIQSITRLGSSGEGGNIDIVSKQINIQNGGVVSAASLGTGNAGNVKIVADSILLDQKGSVLAFSDFQEGGNINLQIKDLLILRNSSEILASANGIGNGGNINIQAGIVIGLEGSQINANAFGGNGGNILINTKGLFFSPIGNITASSSFGVSGNIAISNLDLSTKNAFISTVEDFVKVDAIIANSCLARRNAAQGSFVVTGSGGLPESPYNQLASEYPVTSIQPIPNSTINSHSPINPLPIVAQKYNQQDQKNWRLGDPIVEVRGLVKSQNGEILPVITYADANALGCKLNN